MKVEEGKGDRERAHAQGARMLVMAFRLWRRGAPGNEGISKSLYLDASSLSGQHDTVGLMSCPDTGAQRMCMKGLEQVQPVRKCMTGNVKCSIFKLMRAADCSSSLRQLPETASA